MKYRCEIKSKNPNRAIHSLKSAYLTRLSPPLSLLLLLLASWSILAACMSAYGKGSYLRPIWIDRGFRNAEHFSMKEPEECSKQIKWCWVLKKTSAKDHIVAKKVEKVQNHLITHSSESAHTISGWVAYSEVNWFYDKGTVGRNQIICLKLLY